MKAKRRKDSTFDKDEEIWIIKQYHQGYSSSQVRRNYRKEFGLTERIKALFQCIKKANFLFNF